MLLKDDPRLDPKLGLALKQFELDGEAPPAPVDLKSSKMERLQFINDSEPLYQGLFGLICPDKIMPGNVSNDIVTIEGIDQNEIPLFISKPNNVKGDVPAILHIHGGGMAILSAADIN
jgi:acetyl esterase